jgi:hypothetical protein
MDLVIIRMAMNMKLFEVFKYFLWNKERSKLSPYDLIKPTKFRVMTWKIWWRCSTN